jgi:hypothetical protein
VQDATPARAEQGAHISRPGSSCRGCGGGGILSEGGPCNWCAPDEGEPLEDDVSLEQALRNMGVEP